MCACAQRAYSYPGVYYTGSGTLVAYPSPTDEAAVLALSTIPYATQAPIKYSVLSTNGATEFADCKSCEDGTTISNLTPTLLKNYLCVPGVVTPTNKQCFYETTNTITPLSGYVQTGATTTIPDSTCILTDKTGCADYCLYTDGIYDGHADSTLSVISSLSTVYGVCYKSSTDTSSSSTCGCFQKIYSEIHCLPDMTASGCFAT